MNLSPNKLLFLCAIDRHTNEFCAEPQKLLQLPYLEITSIDDFCSMNGYTLINDYNEINSEAYQKTINRSIIPEDLDNRLYRRHIIGNEEYYICIIEIKLAYLSLLFHRKLPIPNRSFFLKLCSNHHKLLFVEYFLSIFYTHTMSERLIYSDINKDMSKEDIQNQVVNFLTYSEQRPILPVYQSKVLALDDKHSIHIPVGDATGGQFLKTKNVQYNLCLNGSIILADHGLQNKTILVDYIFRGNKSVAEPRNLKSKASLIITSEDKLFEWKEHIMSLGSRWIVITCMEDLMGITYEYLLYVDFVLITINVVESKDYNRLISDYRIGKMSYLHAISVMRDEYKKLNNVLEDVSPVLSLVMWDYIIFDDIRLKEHADIYYSFVCRHKVYLSQPTMDSVDTGIKLLFGYPGYLQKSLLTQGNVQQCLVDQIMVMRYNSVNPALLPNIVNHKINFRWTYPEHFFITYFTDTLKYNLARRLDIIPTNSLVNHINHIYFLEQVKGVVDEYFHKKKDAIDEVLNDLQQEHDRLEQEFLERGIVCTSRQVQVQISDGEMDRTDILGIFEILDKYMHYKHEIKGITETLNSLVSQWEFVFQQVNKLEENEFCEICYDSLEYKNIGFSITCGHIYCYKCLQQHRQSQNRPTKSCPGCRQNMDLRNIVIYHRHPVLEHDIPIYNTKLNILKELIETTDGSYVLYVPQVNDSDLCIIQHELTSNGISCAIYDGNMYERLRLVKMFQSGAGIRVLILAQPLDFTIHAENIILLRSHIETHSLNTINRVPVWDLIKGSFDSLDQRYQELNVYEFNLVDTEYVDV